MVLNAQTGEPAAQFIINYVFTEGQRGHQQIYIVDEHLKVHLLTDYKEEHHFFRISVSFDRKKLCFQVVMNSKRFLKIIDVNSFPEMKSIELLHNVIIHDVSWSADTKYIAVVCGSELPYQLLIIDTSSFNTYTLTRFDEYSPWFQWSLQGHKLLFVKDYKVMFAEPPAGVFGELSIDSIYPVWDETGQGIIVFSKDICHISLDGTRTLLYADVMEHMTLPDDYIGRHLYPGTCLGVKYSLDRKKCILCTNVAPLEVSSYNEMYFFIDIEKKLTIRLSDIFKLESISAFDAQGYMFCDFSPDSMKLVCDYKGGIYILDIEGGSTVRISKADYIFHLPEFSADGSVIFFRGPKQGRSDNEFTYYVTAGGGEIKRLDY